MSFSTHQQFVDKLVDIISRQDEFVGIALGGSWIERQIDEFSDLDVVLIYDPAFENHVIQHRITLAKSLGDLLACFTGEHVGEPRLLICLYDNPLLHVDLKFVTLPDFGQRVEDPTVVWQRDDQLSTVIARTTAQFPHPNLQWIENRFWVWIHYAATKIGRGELFETIAFLSFLQQSVLGPLSLIQQGHLPKGVRKLEFLLPQEDLNELRQTVATVDRTSCLQATKAAAKYYQRLREDLAQPELQRRSRAEQRALAYLDEIDQRIRR